MPEQIQVTSVNQSIYSPRKRRVHIINVKVYDGNRLASPEYSIKSLANRKILTDMNIIHIQEQLRNLPYLGQVSHSMKHYSDRYLPLF
jgi:hypothetical protein